MFSVRKFKRAMINKVLELGSSSTSEGSAFAYVGQMLSWTDMSAMTSICDMLLSVNSPVLYDPAVANEVMNLALAFKTVIKFPYPQYFRVLGPVRDQKLLESSRFPILSSVAQRLRMAKYPTVTQFVATVQTNAAIVERLVNLHVQLWDH